jgi:hypothetical protein
LSGKKHPQLPVQLPTPPERALSGHIFSVSAGLVGVCLTVIGLFHLFRRPGEIQSVADNLIAIDAIIFLFACILAYLGIRSGDERRWRRLESAADGLFLIGISGMVLICSLIAYELI